MQPETPDIPVAPAPETPPALFVQPTVRDREARRRTPAPVAADPEAPYGWIIDKATGERRPKKTAGRQVPGGKPSVAPPKKRAANRPRTATVSEVSHGIPVAKVEHAEQVGGIIDMAWMLAASIPTAEGSLFGIDLHATTVRIKAQASVLAETRDSTARGIGAVADHVGFVGRLVERIGDEGGPAWMMVAAMALIPMVTASVAIWRAPLAEIEARAAQTDAAFAQLVKAQVAQAQPAAQPVIEGEQASAPAGAMFPGESPLPGFDPAA